MIWACAKIEYQQIGNEGRKLEFNRFKNKTRMENDLEDMSEKEYKNIRIQYHTFFDVWPNKKAKGDKKANYKS